MLQGPKAEESLNVWQVPVAPLHENPALLSHVSSVPENGHAAPFVLMAGWHMPVVEPFPPMQVSPSVHETPFPHVCPTSEWGWQVGGVPTHEEPRAQLESAHEAPVTGGGPHVPHAWPGT
jgi:hypothetical protein